MIKKIIKIICLTLFFNSFIYAQNTYEIAKIISNADEIKLRLLFSKEIKDGYTNVDIEKISEMLQASSLFKIVLSNPQEIDIEFFAKTNPILFLNIVTNTLNSLGFVHFYITEFDKNDNNLRIKITLQSSFLIDPGQVYKQLRKNRIFIKEISRLKNGEYSYKLDFSKFSLNTDLVIQKDNSYTLTKPLKGYFLNISDDVKSLKFSTNAGDIWYPKIEFLDKNLNLIFKKEENEIKKEFEILVPQGCKYIIVSDSFAIENIKRGLKLETK